MSAQLDTLREQTRGSVIGPDDPSYDEARRVRNGMIDRRPAVIVRAANAGDVMTAVRYAVDRGLTIAVRGGAHSVPGFGTADDGVVVDLSAMRDIRVDPVNRVARVAGGATWGDLNAATYPFGLATTGGIISTTGVGGLTLGGGIGYLARGLGFSCDNLVAADVVTGGRDLPHRQREGRRRPVLGDPRRRRQLRGRHVVRVPAQPGQGHLRGTDVLRAGQGGRPDPALPGVHRRTLPSSSAGSRRTRSRRRCRSSSRPGTGPRWP